MVDKDELSLPQKEPLPLQTECVPYVIVADDVFALSPNVMKPYPGLHAKGSVERVFNYRL